MAELKTYKRRREKEEQQIDHIPKYFQQRRSPTGPKRRTDFSLFVCSSSSSISKDILIESPSSKEILSSVTIASLDEIKDTREDILDLPQVCCTKPQDETEGLFPNCVEVPVIEVDSVDPKQLCEQWSNRNVDKQREDALGALDFSPNKSQTTESSDACTAPGSVVWAKKACEVWWPAEIVEKGSTSVGSTFQGSGQVLVQYYGNEESAWIDPASDISQFEDGFEERSCNPMEEFQDALKQALNQKETPTSCKQLSGSPDGPDCSNRQDQSTGDKCNSSSSSRTEIDYLGRSGRSKRKIKPKLHFDDVTTVPLKSPKKVRRLKIMRSLGLAAPVGSPFSPAPDDVFTSN
ncbi:hypothetical protein LguiB_015799 [Lonicera macranthoides]